MGTGQPLTVWAAWDAAGFPPITASSLTGMEIAETPFITGADMRGWRGRVGGTQLPQSLYPGCMWSRGRQQSPRLPPSIQRLVEEFSEQALSVGPRLCVRVFFLWIRDAESTLKLLRCCPRRDKWGLGSRGSPLNKSCRVSGVQPQESPAVQGQGPPQVGD